MENKIHPALKHKYIAERYYYFLGKNYSLETSQKMFHQDLRTSNLKESTLLKVLKELVSEQKELIFPRTKH